jgi:ABC-type multidrug transport system fused ATPase/permease subunit
MKALLFIQGIFRSHGFLLMATIALVVTMTITEALSIICIAPIIDLLVGSEAEVAGSISGKIKGSMQSLGIPITLGSILGVFLVFNVFKSGFAIWVRYSIMKVKYTVLGDILIGTFVKFFRAKWYFFTSQNQGKIINTFIREIAVVGDAFGSIAVLFASIIQTFVYLAVPLYISWQTTLVCMFFAILFITPLMRLGKIGAQLGMRTTSTANDVSSVIQENCSLAKVVLGFGRQSQSAEYLARVYDAHREAAVKGHTLRRAIPQIYFPFGIIVLIIGLLMAREQNVPLGEVAVLLYSMLRVIPTIGEIAAEKNTLDNFFPSYEQIINMQQQAEKLEQPSGKKNFDGFENELAIRNLTFSYSGNGQILDISNVVIPKGKFVAFVGMSGSGKTTLLDMIVGFHAPGTGQVLLDGTPLQDFDVNSYRHRIGYVPQDSALFNMSILDNLIWSKPDATEDEIKGACQLANADLFIDDLEDGLDTVVGDRGIRLSGGQVQRIALARAILRKPEILVLDEATSALDTESEKLIQAAIEKIGRETTIVVVAHRLSTITKADYIYLLQKGSIIEEGNFHTLISMNGQFKKMLSLQNIENDEKNSVVDASLESK